MPGEVLTTSSIVMCPHGGQAILITSNNSAFAVGSPVLLEKDIHPVVGCPFTIGPKYSPCIRIEWSNGTQRTSSRQNPILVKTSIGKCINAEGALQGVAIIVMTQPRVDSQ